MRQPACVVEADEKEDLRVVVVDVFESVGVSMVVMVV